MTIPLPRVPRCSHAAGQLCESLPPGLNGVYAPLNQGRVQLCCAACQRCAAGAASLLASSVTSCPSRWGLSSRVCPA